MLQRALDTPATIEGQLRFTDRRGEPLCAAVRPPTIHWCVAEPDW